MLQGYESEKERIFATVYVDVSNKSFDTQSLAEKILPLGTIEGWTKQNKIHLMQSFLKSGIDIDARQLSNWMVGVNPKTGKMVNIRCYSRIAGVNPENGNVFNMRRYSQVLKVILKCARSTTIIWNSNYVKSVRVTIKTNLLSDFFLIQRLIDIVECPSEAVVTNSYPVGTNASNMIMSMRDAILKKEWWRHFKTTYYITVTWVMGRNQVIEELHQKFLGPVSTPQSTPADMAQNSPAYDISDDSDDQQRTLIETAVPFRTRSRSQCKEEETVLPVSKKRKHPTHSEVGEEKENEEEQSHMTELEKYKMKVRLKELEIEKEENERLLKFRSMEQEERERKRRFEVETQTLGAEKLRRKTRAEQIEKYLKLLDNQNEMMKTQNDQIIQLLDNQKESTKKIQEKLLVLLSSELS